MYKKKVEVNFMYKGAGVKGAGVKGIKGAG